MAENKKYKIIWTYGSYLKRRKLLSKVYERFVDSDCFICDENASFDLLLSEIESFPCFKEHKVIVINSMPKVDNKQKKMQILLDAIKNIHENTFVVFNDIDIDSYKNIFEYVEKEGKIYHYETGFKNENPCQWIVNYFHENKRNISEESSLFLVDNFAFDESFGDVSRDQVQMICDTLILYKDKKSSITNEDIMTCVFENSNFIIWSLIDLLDKKDADKCFEFINKIAYNEDSYIKCASSIIPVLLWRYKMLFFVKECIYNFKDSSKAFQFVSDMKKLSQSGNGFYMKMNTEKQKNDPEKYQTLWNAYSLNKIFYGSNKVVESYSRKDLYRIIMILNDISFILRNQPSDSSIAICLDVLVMSICKTVDDKVVTVLLQSMLKNIENNI